MSLAVLTMPPLMQKVQDNLGVKPAKEQLKPTVPKKKTVESVSAGEKKELGIIFTVMTLISYLRNDRAEAPKGRKSNVYKMLDEKFYPACEELFGLDRYKKHRSSIAAKGARTVHNAFNTNVNGVALEIPYLCLVILHENFERWNRAIPLNDTLDQWWSHWYDRVGEMMDKTYDYYAKRFGAEYLQDTYKYALHTIASAK